LAVARKLNNREIRLIAVAAILAIAVMAVRLGSGRTTLVSGSKTAEGKTEPLPRIDLGRLAARPQEAKAGQRDIFEFGRPPAPPISEREPEPPTVMAEVVPTPVPTPQLPPLNVKFIGSLDDSRGLKVAVLLTDKNELLTGQVGEVVANRYRIGKIGFESVDLEDVTSGSTRRVALRSK
jgi:hypothetical protein